MTLCELLQDGNAISKESPRSALINGGNAVHGSESSCTDNNGPGRLGAASSSSGERSSPPVLPSFADMLPPPPLYPPPSGTTAGAEKASADFPGSTLRAGLPPMESVPRVPTQCHTCQRGYHQSGGIQRLGPHFVPESQDRLYNPTMPHMHSFSNSPYAANAEYQTTYPSMPRADCKHSYQPYNVCHPHGHSSDSHDYAEPQFDCLSQPQNIYDGVPPILRHQTGPPAAMHPSRQQFTDNSAGSARPMMAHQNTMPILAQHEAIPAGALGGRHHSVPSSEHELCMSCAEQTEYEEPWSDQHWPMMWHPNHGHHAPNHTQMQQYAQQTGMVLLLYAYGTYHLAIDLVL